MIPRHWILDLCGRLTAPRATTPIQDTEDRLIVVHSTAADILDVDGTSVPCTVERLGRIATRLTADTDSRLARIALLLRAERDT